jgi:hypothetical protein
LDSSEEFVGWFGFDEGAHGPVAATPFIEELAVPGRQVVIAELLKSFFEKIRPDSLQVVAEEITEGEGPY